MTYREESGIRDRAHNIAEWVRYRYADLHGQRVPFAQVREEIRAALGLPEDLTHAKYRTDLAIHARSVRSVGLRCFLQPRRINKREKISKQWLLPMNRENLTVAERFLLKPTTPARILTSVDQFLALIGNELD